MKEIMHNLVARLSSEVKPFPDYTNYSTTWLGSHKGYQH